MQPSELIKLICQQGENLIDSDEGRLKTSLVSNHCLWNSQRFGLWGVERASFADALPQLVNIENRDLNSVCVYSERIEELAECAMRILFFALDGGGGGPWISLWTILPCENRADITSRFISRPDSGSRITIVARLIKNFETVSVAIEQLLIIYRFSYQNYHIQIIWSVSNTDPSISPKSILSNLIHHVLGL